MSGTTTTHYDNEGNETGTSTTEPTEQTAFGQVAGGIMEAMLSPLDAGKDGNADSDSDNNSDSDDES